MVEIKHARTCVVIPLYLARTSWMFTCGMMFFSIVSWNKGGGGRSMARKRKGETLDLISIWVCKLINDEKMGTHNTHLGRCQI